MKAGKFMNNTNVMLDLETWGNSPNSVITSIGAVKFNLNPDNSGGNIIDEFYYRINPQSCVDEGLTMSVDTILWWMNQSHEARSEFQEPTTPLKKVLTYFTTWLSDTPKNIDIWGNGSDFDNVILANAYRACELELPWKFFNNRCFRTLKNIYPDVPSLGVSPAGVKHNALDDAKSQAWRLIDILSYINKSISDNTVIIPEAPEIAPKNEAVRVKKETVRISLPPKSGLKKIPESEKKFVGFSYDDKAFEKAYNRRSGIRSSSDCIKGMKIAKEFDIL
jgi:inhibitor of KinA sporulation pathway (predicted exonuclease)